MQIHIVIWGGLQRFPALRCSYTDLIDHCYHSFSVDATIIELTNTVEPRSTDTRLIRTPGYCGQFHLSRRGKAHTFSLKLTRLIRTLWRPWYPY